jgi:hypothetical protein
MAEPTKGPMTKETLQRIAREQGRFALDDASADSLLDLVNDLQNQADDAGRVDRKGLDPATEYALEDWSRD